MGQHTEHVVAQCSIKNRTPEECDATEFDSSSIVWFIIKTCDLNTVSTNKTNNLKH